MLEYVVDKNNFDGFAKAILSNGKSCYSEKTKEDYLKEGLSVVDEDEMFKIREAWENGLIGHWIEVTEREYDNQLNVLPPLKWHDGGFFMSEFYTGTLTSFYQKWKGKFYTSLQRIGTNRAEIINSLQAFIKEQEGVK